MNYTMIKIEIEGFEDTTLYLTFIVWDDKRVYCFVDIEDESTMYWYMTTEIENQNNLDNEIDKLIENYTDEYIEEIENYATSEGYRYGNEENITSKYIYR